MNESLRPKSVVLGVSLFVGTIAIGTLRTLVLPAPGPRWIAATVLIVMLALTIAVWRRRNWARILVLVLFLVGLPTVFFIRELLLQEGSVSVAILLVQTAMQCGALLYLFARESNAWFRARAPQ